MEDYEKLHQEFKSKGLIRPIIFKQVQNCEEEFKPITNIHVDNVIAGKYEISNYGKVKDTINNRYLSLTPDKDGYLCCGIRLNNHTTKTIKVHRLEKIVFDPVENSEELQVNHKDNHKDNNILSNLEWTTPKQNSDHAMIYNIHKMKGEDNINSKLSSDQVKEICLLIESRKYYDIEIAKMFNVSNVTISDIHNRKIWNHISKDFNIDAKKSKKKNV